MCCVTVGGDPWTAKHHHWKSEAKGDNQLSPVGPSNRGKSPGPNQLKWKVLGWAIIESDADQGEYTCAILDMLVFILDCAIV